MDRRGFMNQVLLTGGAAAFGLMTGACSSGGSAPGASPSGTRSRPSGGPGGGQGTVSYADFTGVTTDGTVVPDLYAIHSTGVSTRPVAGAATWFLNAFDRDQQQELRFEIESDQWLNWSNVHNFPRKGIALKDMSTAQRKAGLTLLTRGLSAKGLALSNNIRRLNHVAGRLLGKLDEFDEDLYYFTMMGTPSTTEPWGFQFQGHHLVINYFVLGDQVVMTPSFWGSEPTVGYYDDGSEIELFTDEIEAALAMLNSLDDEQRSTAVISADKSSDNEKAGAGKDNAVIPYQGVKGADLTTAQAAKLVALIEPFVTTVDTGHAKIKMEEVAKHLDDTYFAWIGPTGRDAAFYFRVQSPVILIELDCQGPGPASGAVEPAAKPGNATATAVASGGTNGAGGGGAASRNHIHSVVRTPNGNDYGFDLLKEHLAADHSGSPSPTAS